MSEDQFHGYQDHYVPQGFPIHAAVAARRGRGRFEIGVIIGWDTLDQEDGWKAVMLISGSGRPRTVDPSKIRFTSPVLAQVSRWIEEDTVREFEKGNR